MDTIKDVVIDALLLVGAWLIVTASGMTKNEQGWSCGRVGVEASAKP